MASSPLARLVLVGVCVAVACSRSTIADTITRIDGTVHAGVKLAGIDAGTLTFTSAAGDDPQQVALVDLREIELQQDLKVSTGRIHTRVWTADGSILEGTLGAGAPGQIVVESRLFAPVTIPFESLVAWNYDDSGRSASEVTGFEEERSRRQEAEDVLFLRSKGTWVRVLGITEAITPTEVRITWEGTTRHVPLQHVGGVVFAAGGRQPGASSGAARVRLFGGSELVGTIGTYDGKTLVLELPGGVVVPIIAGALEKITFLTDRIAYLSDRDPAAFREASFFGREWSYRRDANVMGGALKLGRVSYEKGLGVHSAATLEYELTGDYDTFSAVIGLDDEGSSMGSVTFRVLLDGTEALAHSAAYGSPPQVIRLPLGGASRLTLEVDYGKDNLDVGDLANWADAKLTR